MDDDSAESEVSRRRAPWLHDRVRRESEVEPALESEQAPAEAVPAPRRSSVRTVQTWSSSETEEEEMAPAPSSSSDSESGLLPTTPPAPASLEASEEALPDSPVHRALAVLAAAVRSGRASTNHAPEALRNTLAASQRRTSSLELPRPRTALVASSRRESGAPPPAAWSTRQVGSWLKESGFWAYRRAFLQQAVSGALLVRLSDSQLKHDLGVGALGHRAALLGAIGRLRGEEQRVLTPLRRSVHNAPRSPVPARLSPAPRRAETRAVHEAERARQRAEMLQERARVAAAAAASAAAAAAAASAKLCRRSVGARDADARTDAFLASSLWSLLGERVDVSAATLDALLETRAQELHLCDSQGRMPASYARLCDVAALKALDDAAEGAGSQEEQQAALAVLDAFLERLAEARKAWLAALLRRRAFDARLRESEARRRAVVAPPQPRTATQRSVESPTFAAFLRRQWASLPAENTLRGGRGTPNRPQLRTASPEKARLPPPRRLSADELLVLEYGGDRDAASLAAEMRARASWLRAETAIALRRQRGGDV